MDSGAVSHKGSTDRELGFIAFGLNQILSAYIENFNPNQPNVRIWGCDIKLKNLKLKRGALDKFRLPIDVVEGSIGSLVLTMDYPWSAIDNIYLLAIPSSENKFNPEDDERHKQATKMQKLKNSELLLSSTAGTPGNTSTEEAEKNESFVAAMTNKILDNLRLRIKNVHICYEDKISVPGHPFSIGLTLAELSAVSTDENFRKSIIVGSKVGVHKLTSLDLLKIYKEHGQIQLRLMFRPNFILPSWEATSTFTGGFGRLATGLSGTVLPTGAGVGIGASKGVGTLGGGVLKGVGGVGKLGYSGIKWVTGGNKRESIIGEDLENVAMEEAPSALDSKMGTIPTVGSRELLSSSPSKTTTKSITDFKLYIMIIGASELESSETKTYVHVKRNEKPVYDTKTIQHTSLPEWNEAIVLDVNTGLETELSFVVYDKKKLGKDREIKMVKLNVWEVLKSQAGQQEAELNKPFREGIGTLKIKLALTDFDSSGKSFKEASPKQNVSGGSPLGLLSSLTGGSHHHLPLALPTISPQKSISTIVQPQASFLDQDPNELAAGTINQKPNNRPGGGQFSFHRNR
ncbi:hypothetical protein O181_067452 [Austropuccinia psidii MF-1]|uniref:C2 domain-containing protein n=1 Tax=Austropuccinia psidii MF-1 TaxID=1389203 RepID=A0A9Q3EXE0_9BASI|nr:hypothetical protein [Austropuccinia psidii MF-1]